MFSILKEKKKSARRILAGLMVLTLIFSFLPFSLFRGINLAKAWSDAGGGDHGGENWTPSDGATIAGNHTNIGTFTVTNGYTINVDASVHYLEIHASTVSIAGTLNANGAGGAGGAKDTVINGSGNVGSDGPGATDKGGTGGAGGKGYNNGDLGGAGAANAGGGGGGGSYYITGDPGGDGGSYAGGGGSGGIYSSATYYGGAGGAGGGKISLYGDINITGTIKANGSNGSNGNLGGGGAGGGGGNIYLYGGSVTAGTLEVIGGIGGKDIYSTDGTYGGGGGGGGGGYIYIGYTSSYTAGTYSIDGGAGGYARGGAYAQPGEDGTDGSTTIEQLNSPPTITSVSDSPDPQESGLETTFSSTASDPDSDNIKLYVCQDSSCTNCEPGNTADCYAASASAVSSDPSAVYTTSDTGSYNYWAKVCDTNDLCSDSLSGGTFSVVITPLSPTNIWTNDAVNPSDVTNSSPVLSAEYDNSNTSDTATYYQVQVIAEGGSWDTPYWDSTKSACSVDEGDRLEITYSGPNLNFNYQKYYQRWRFWDSSDLEGDWSEGTDYFITAVSKDEFGANVRGYAWSDNIGWLSFNNSDVDTLTASYNSGTGELEGWGWSDNIGWISLNCATDDSCNPATADHQVNIDESGNLSGEAWSDNLGWLSFNRADTGNPPGDPYQTTGAIARYDSGTKEFSGWAKFLIAPEGGWDGWIKLRCYGAECSAEGWTEGTGAMSGVFINDDGNFQGWAWGSDVVGWIGFQGPGACDYGVTIDEESNKLSGHVWSENLGWISFDRDETGTPPSDDPCVDESCIARLKEDNYQLDGWARALNYGDGWDGWISLNKKTGDSYDYEVTLNVDSKEFEGWAYGSDVLGWISFNHLTDDSGIDYMVYTGLPMGIQPTDPHDTWDLCSDSLHPTLNWSVDGDINGYEVEIYSDADFNNLVYRYQSDVSSTSHHASHGADNFDDSLGTCGENGFQDASNCNLQYGGTDYWWRVRVRNLDNVWGNWSVTDAFKVVSAHHWPLPSFSTNPTEPQTGSITSLLDESSTYGEATASSWQWLFSGDEDLDYSYANETTSTSQNPEVTFLTNETETVTLQTTDSDGYGPCSCSGQVELTSGSVQWHEVSPSSGSTN
jgi:hypothetical protein